ncbi:MAG: alpha/beta fold hydrolase [Proteobacteria bacterium]|nr:alpha/beta fold hydrolase [Pseudomonadota bacterium]
MSELFRIPAVKSHRPAVDVVFVHGLGGDARETWTAANGSFWPEWLASDLAEVNIWSLGYEASPLRFGQAMPIADRAVNAITQLQANGLGSAPVVFVCHSLGGLLVKQMIRKACDGGVPEMQWLARQTKGVVFLATPHTGSTAATWLDRIFGSIVGPQLEELREDSSALRELNQWYRNNASRLGIRHQAYSETRALKGFTIVDLSSADPGVPGLTPIPLDEDHSSICKPRDRSSLIYLRVRALVVHVSQVEAATPSLSQEYGIGRTVAVVATLPDASLRRQIAERFNRPEIAVLWFDTFGDAMDDHVPGKPVNECIIELLLRAKRQKAAGRLYESIALERPDLADVLANKSGA